MNVWKKTVFLAGISLLISLAEVVMIYLTARYGRLWLRMILRPGNVLF